MDYTESDSAFYNTEVPEDHYSYDNFDLYYHFDGDTAWVKIKKGKELKAALLTNEASLSATKKYKKKMFFGKVVLVGGLAGGAAAAWLVSPLGGGAIIVASGGLGYYIINKADKHLFEAIHLYNQSIK